MNVEYQLQLLTAVVQKLIDNAKDLDELDIHEGEIAQDDLFLIKSQSLDQSLSIRFADLISSLNDVIDNEDKLDRGGFDGTAQDIVDLISEPPVYVLPTSSITNISGINEVGSTKQINITQAFNQNDGGAKVSEEITKNGIVVSNSNIFSENLIVPIGNTVYGGGVDYEEGPCKLNNVGIEDCDGRVEAGSTNSADRTVRGIYPIFYFKSSAEITPTSMVAAIENGTAQKIVVDSAGTITVPYAPDSEHVAIAYPATSPTKTRWFVTELSQGDIPGGVFSGQTTLSVDNYDGFWAGVNFKIHVTGVIFNPGATNIELRN